MDWKKISLALILLFAWGTRVWGINWDSGYHFHPDERMIVMVTDRLEWVNPISDWEEFSDKNSRFNPAFFAYGSLPIYALWFFSNLLEWVLDVPIANYDGMLYAGRAMSAIFDTVIVLLVYLIGKKLRNESLGLWSALLYALAVFPIQTSHFFAVDTLLSLWSILLLWLIVKDSKVSRSKLIVVGVVWGLAMATKASGVILGGGIGLWLLYRQWRLRGKGVTRAIGNLILHAGLVGFVGLVIMSILQPYMWFDSTRFWADLVNQSRMRSDAWTFPYTRQYIGTLPYIYNLEQIGRFGLGWGQSLLVLLGIYKLWGEFRMKSNKGMDKWLWVVVWIAIFIVPFGMYAVKFMRYLLPIYPMLCLVGGMGLGMVMEKKTRLGLKILGGVGLVMSVGWWWAFMNIYSDVNTRISASKWMSENLTGNTTLAIEHWDDALPVPPWHGGFGQESMALYETDNKQKWQEISKQLEQVDVIVIASNRLYAPLMRLEDKYPIAGGYYKKLFSGELGFELVHESNNYPRIGPWVINDQGADESFHVYDRPKVMVFGKNKEYTANQYYDLITENKL